MSQHPLTVVEAPSGFGKITAVREYLHNEPPDAVCAWHTCLGEPSAVAWGEMKRHSVSTSRIAQATPELAAVADLILSHHERWDGKEYPRSLKGEEIPIACRILSVVDAYDAMTNDRVYRKAMTSHDAIQEIRKNMEKQFDPRIAELFIEILAEEKRETMGPVYHDRQIRLIFAQLFLFHTKWKREHQTHELCRVFPFVWMQIKKQREA